MRALQTMALALALLGTQAQADDGLLYRTSAVRTLPGSGHSWGFAALDPARPLLLIARRENGLTPFDVDKQQALPTLANTTGANAVAFVPRHNRAYVANMDGTLGILDLAQLKVLQRLPVDSGNLNNLLYDAHSDRVIITSGRRGDHSTLYLLDPATDRLVGQRDIAARKLDGPIGLSDGRFIVPLRDEDQVAVLSGPLLAQQRLLSFPGCHQPSALAADEQGGRLFIACRGGQPQLVIADLASGAPLQTLPIGRAVNAMAFDAARQQLLIPSGADASLGVVGKAADGSFRLLGSLGTRPWAHNMVFDAARASVYLLAMDFTQPAPTTAVPKPDPQFHPDTFSVLTLKAQ